MQNCNNSILMINKFVEYITIQQQKPVNKHSTIGVEKPLVHSLRENRSTDIETLQYNSWFFVQYPSITNLVYRIIKNDGLII
jgi:hypothetical protein